MTKPRVVLVTGGTRGIGKCIADGFVGQGDTVVVCGRRAPKADSPAFLAADLRESDACSALIEEVQKRFGRLDVLVNNAGGSPPADTSTVSPRFSEKIIRLNLLAPLWLSQAANAVMQGQESGGVIVHIASVSGLRASPTTAAYGAAKAGLLNLTQTQALEWAPKVRVVALSPGLVATENTAAHYPEVEKIIETIPAGRFCTPEDVAQATLWLSSEAASYATGTNLILDGGGDWPAFLRP
jgi:NAD(P)-dependent dehydrogenase (short-subunit alcohol dehydrogenase family)